MRKKLLFVILLVTSMTIGCGQSRHVDLKNACIGVIETNGSNKKSRLLIYDDNLTELVGMPMKYASIGSIFYNPCVYGNDLYVIPQGLANRKDEQKVLSVDLSALETKTYDIEQLAMNSICVDDENIYTCNTLNGDSYINKCSKKDQSVKTQVIGQMYVSKIVCEDGNVYAFGTIKEESAFKSYLYILDHELHLKEQLDITEYGSSHYKALVQEGSIYFPNTYDSKDEPCNTVCVFSIKDKTFHTIQLEQDYPWDLDIYQNLLIVSHYNLSSQKGGFISICDLDTEEVCDYPLEHTAEQMTVKDDAAYILSEKNLYKYKWSASGIKMENKVEIDTHGSNYCSGVFSY